MPLITDPQLHKFPQDHHADNMHEYLRQLQRFNVGEDCPVFDGLFEFCQLYTSGSIGGAVRSINSGAMW